MHLVPHWWPAFGIVARDVAWDAQHALSLLVPYAAELMRAVPASRRVNSIRNDDARLLVADELLAA